MKTTLHIEIEHNEELSDIMNALEHAGFHQAAYDFANAVVQLPQFTRFRRIRVLHEYTVIAETAKNGASGSLWIQEKITDVNMCMSCRVGNCHSCIAVAANCQCYRESPRTHGKIQ